MTTANAAACPGRASDRDVWAEKGRDRVLARHRRDFEGRFFRLPQRLAKEGVLSGIWQLVPSRSRGLASSLLPVLALHNWKPADDAWTTWKAVPARHLAALAGLCEASVRPAFSVLETAGLLESREGRRRRRQGGPPPIEFRLALSVFPHTVNGEATEKFVIVESSLIYGGWWALLPTHAARHLYLTLAGFDAVANPSAFRNSEDDDPDTQPERILEARERSGGISTRELSKESGLSLSAVGESLTILRRPIAMQLSCDPASEMQPAGMIERGRSNQDCGDVFWYAPTRNPDGRCAMPGELALEVFNRPSAMRAKRAELWPESTKEPHPVEEQVTASSPTEPTSVAGSPYRLGRRATLPGWSCRTCRTGIRNVQTATAYRPIEY